MDTNFGKKAPGSEEADVASAGGSNAREVADYEEEEGE